MQRWSLWMEKLPDTDRRRAVVQTETGPPYDFDLIELIYNQLKRAGS
jgi:hypothetical protein